MPKTDSTRYTFLFATAVCVVCALLVAVSAVGLRDRQENNQLVYRQKNVLLAAGLVKPDQKLSDRELQAIFDKNIVVRLIDLKTGEMIPEGKIDARATTRRRRATTRRRVGPRRRTRAASRGCPTTAPSTSSPRASRTRRPSSSCCRSRAWRCGPPSTASSRWSATATRCAGSPSTTRRRRRAWAARSATRSGRRSGRGARPTTRTGSRKLTVIKGQAGPPDKDPHRIDGLSGATITSNGISRLVAFWFSKDGYGPFLKTAARGSEIVTASTSSSASTRRPR